jgi:hypothetical protein
MRSFYLTLASLALALAVDASPLADAKERALVKRGAVLTGQFSSESEVRFI